MKTKPHPKSHRATSTARALRKPEQPAPRIAPPMPPATAALLEKLDGLRAAQLDLSDAEMAAKFCDEVLERTTKSRFLSYEKRSAARRALVNAETALAAQLATMPLTPIKHKGETFIHVPGAGLQSFKGEPLALGVQP